MKDIASANTDKFKDPFITAKGETRASVELHMLETVWFNTGTLCNIECLNCYIESSPTNDKLVYLTTSDVVTYLDELDSFEAKPREIGFTGGEPFMNPDFPDMIQASLERGYEVLVLTNAMRPMMRKRVQAALIPLIKDYADRLTFRISVDHWSQDNHDTERGNGSFETMLTGMRWLRDQGARLAIAGRTVWGESDADARAGYAALFAENAFDIDAYSPAQTVLFPEMDMTVEVPEITTECWGILGKSQSDVMCSSSRMVVKRKGAKSPVVLACTLLTQDPEFELGKTLKDASKPVQLNHPHCAKFCVLGGASCSA